MGKYLTQPRLKKSSYPHKSFVASTNKAFNSSNIALLTLKPKHYVEAYELLWKDCWIIFGNQQLSGS